MAVISTREIWRGRGGYFAGVLEYELSRVFRVTTNSAYDDTTVILAAGVLPAIGAADTLSPALTVRSYSFQQPEATPLVWEVQVNYSSAPDSTDDPDADPLALEPAISWNWQERQRVLAVDVLGTAVVNSAFDQFDEPIMVDDARLIANVRVNVASIPTWIIDYNNTMNNAAITIDGLSVAESCALFKVRSLSEVKVQSGSTYREFQYELHLNRDTWFAQPLDLGWNELSARAGTKKPIMINDGQSKPNAPQLLDGAGRYVGDGIGIGASLIFAAYPATDFSILPGIT